MRPLVKIVGLALLTLMPLASQSGTTSCLSLAKKLRTLPAALPPRLCFSGQVCQPSDMSASTIWLNSDEPEEIKSTLEENANWSNWFIERAPMKTPAGELLRLSRRIGTASCLKDAYFFYRSGKYRMLNSKDLDELSVEAGHCGNDNVWLLPGSSNPMLALREVNNLRLYSLNGRFALRLVCSLKNAFPQGPRG